MNIRATISDYHSASESQRNLIREKLGNDFQQLSDEEKKEVQRVFIESQHELIEEGKAVIEELKLKTELEKVSRFVSMSFISRNFFGKSRQWLNNRVKGNMVNGKPAAFTRNELTVLSDALNQLAGEMKQTALRISH
ncbi:MAG: DUF5053 domain-containing protein [Tannerella sp.]|jgi:hypothetical protein|nr:DUF5053 domain-containing protein [Tannerella sp.]